MDTLATDTQAQNLPLEAAAPEITAKEVTETRKLAPAVSVNAGSTLYTGLYADPYDATSDLLYVENLKLQIAVTYLKQGTPVAFLGESGSGKTEIARAIMARINTDRFYQMEFGGIVSGDMLDGIFTLQGAETVHLPTEHLKAVRDAAAGLKVGYVLDELNRASPSGINKLLRLYGQSEYVSDIDGVLKINKRNLLSIATLNIGFGFTGTSRVDGALVTRFKAIKLSSPHPDILSRVLVERYPSIDAKDVKAICAIYKASRENSKSYQLGVRDALGLAELAAAGIRLIDAVETVIGGAAKLMSLNDETVDAVIAVAKSVVK